MGILIVVAAFYWWTRMGGQATVQNLIGSVTGSGGGGDGGGGGGSASAAVPDIGGNISQAFTDKNGNNIINQRSINTSSNTGVHQQHGTIQQSSNINGVVRTNNRSFYSRPLFL